MPAGDGAAAPSSAATLLTTPPRPTTTTTRPARPITATTPPRRMTAAGAGATAIAIGFAERHDSADRRTSGAGVPANAGLFFSATTTRSSRKVGPKPAWGEDRLTAIPTN